MWISHACCLINIIMGITYIAVTILKYIYMCICDEASKKRTTFVHKIKRSIIPAFSSFGSFLFAKIWSDLLIFGGQKNIPIALAMTVIVQNITLLLNIANKINVETEYTFGSVSDEKEEKI